jgi:hypothetical protein
MLDEEVIERFPDDARLREGFKTVLPFSSGSSVGRFKSARIEKQELRRWNTPVHRLMDSR